MFAFFTVSNIVTFPKDKQGSIQRLVIPISRFVFHRTKVS